VATSGTLDDGPVALDPVVAVLAEGVSLVAAGASTGGATAGAGAALGAFGFRTTI
jgi:hypothetical protein